MQQRIQLQKEQKKGYDKQINKRQTQITPKKNEELIENHISFLSTSIPEDVTDLRAHTNRKTNVATVRLIFFIEEDGC